MICLSATKKYNSKILNPKSGIRLSRNCPENNKIFTTLAKLFRIINHYRPWWFLFTPNGNYLRQTCDMIKAEWKPIDPPLTNNPLKQHKHQKKRLLTSILAPQTGIYSIVLWRLVNIEFFSFFPSRWRELLNMFSMHYISALGINSRMHKVTKLLGPLAKLSYKNIEVQVHYIVQYNDASSFSHFTNFKSNTHQRTTRTKDRC